MSAHTIDLSLNFLKINENSNFRNVSRAILVGSKMVTVSHPGKVGRFSGLGICFISNYLYARYGGTSEGGEVVGDRLNKKTKAAVLTRQSSTSPDVLLNPFGFGNFLQARKLTGKPLSVKDGSTRSLWIPLLRR